MASRIDGVLERRLGHHRLLTKLVRYGAASAAAILTSQTVLIFLLVVVDTPAIPANIVAVTVSSIPNYLINRAWTFNKRGTHSWSREVLPFWLMALAGLVLSTVAVAWADRRFGGNALAVSAASVGAFGVLWIAKFFVLERVLFAPLTGDPEAG